MARVFSWLMCLLLLSSFSFLYASEKGGEDKKGEGKKQTEVRPDVKKALASKYPVAIAKGESVNIDYKLPEEGNVSFRVTDFKGEEHFGFTETFEAGENTISFNTFGLEVGNYLVEISSPETDQEKEMMLTVVK